MQLDTRLLTFLCIATFSSLTNALPSTEAAPPPAVAFGQQLQNNDETNHWVTWVEGEDACPGMQVLDVLTQPACDKSFQHGEVIYTFTGCSSDGAILDSSGIQIGGCSTVPQQHIGCKDNLHDIVKHGTCVIITTD
jgi:hypothetical protein